LYQLGEIEVGDHAVVFEVDDVCLSSYHGFKESGYRQITPLAHEWLKKGKASPIIPVLKFFTELRDQGATIFLVSRRLQMYRDATERNLEHAGFVGYEQLIMRPELDMQNHVPVAEYKVH